MGRPPKAHFEAIQSFLDDALKGVGSLLFLNTEEQFQMTDIVTNISDFSMSENDIRFKPIKFYSHQPRVRSQMVVRRQNTLKANILAYEKRNAGVVKSLWHPDVTDEVMTVVDDFFNSYVDSRKLSEILADAVEPNVFELCEWYLSRNPLGKKALKLELDKPVILDSNLNRFKLMVKADVKFKTDLECLSEMPPGQNIVFHERAICAHFSVCFRELVNRLRTVVRKNVVLFNGLSFEEFADQLSAALDDESIDAFKCDEIDISKYDKSQSTFTKAVELEIYRRLGLPENILQVWAASEFFGKAVTNKRSFSAEVYAQRRTGAANTWIGNTVVNMMLLSQSVDVTTLNAVCFAGDDSLILKKDVPGVNFDVYDLKYEFDVKYYDCASKYFCGKFLIENSGKIKVMPDPFKIFVKLGKERPQNDKILMEQWRSFFDVTEAYTSEANIVKLVASFQNKWVASPHAYESFCTINSLRSNPEQFKRLWFDLYKFNHSRFEGELSFDVECGKISWGNISIDLHCYLRSNCNTFIIISTSVLAK
uniref:RNA-dependent RNA polymerase n=1 Tax=Pineapple mealybug wilt-associated virus 1 TaxID=180903 RepID=A0A4D6G3I5_9CLOS|nr:RNA-dependent RNA polymerase [Pineapple mealybug wilt-associated virus 1]